MELKQATTHNICSRQNCFPPYSEFTNLKLQPAVFAARDLMERLRDSGMPDMDLRRVEKALDLMFAVHIDQTRVDGAPYVYHTLLVARVLAFKFGFHDPCAIVAALLHDAPEDQAGRVTALLGGRRKVCQQAAIDEISQAFEPKPAKVHSYLRALTNPDFDSLIAALREPEKSAPEAVQEAEHLLNLGAELTAGLGGNRLELSATDMRNLMYLGHWKELSESDSTAFAIKVADFFSNGLHGHLLRRELEDLSPSSEQHEWLAKKSAKLAAKYGPVVSFLLALFEQANDEGRTLISAGTDRLLLKKLHFLLTTQAHARSSGSVSVKQHLLPAL